MPRAPPTLNCDWFILSKQLQDESEAGIKKKYPKNKRTQEGTMVQTCVCPCVPLELVAACESFPTENPVADEGPLSGVQPDVSSEQRRLPERLLTTGNVADVLPLPHLPRPEGKKEHIDATDLTFLVNLLTL